MTDDKGNVVPFRGRADAAAERRGTVDGMVAWLRRAGIKIEVLHDEVGPYATPGVGVPTHPHTLWVTNGEGGNSWGGAMIARCATKQDAGLVQRALEMLASTSVCEQCASIIGDAELHAAFHQREGR